MRIPDIFSQIPPIKTTTLPTTVANQDRIEAVLGIVFGVLGTIAVLIIVFGGFRYIIAKGSPQDMAQARNTILYAVVGLGICIMAYSIVTFVIGNI